MRSTEESDRLQTAGPSPFSTLSLSLSKLAGSRLVLEINSLIIQLCLHRDQFTWTRRWPSALQAKVRQSPIGRINKKTVTRGFQQSEARNCGLDAAFRCALTPIKRPQRLIPQ
jgi:hypothetical protein